jgi:hypothetical protein
MEQSNIAFQINHSVKSMVEAYVKEQGLDASYEHFLSELSLVFALQNPFMDKVNALDALLEKFSALKPLAEVLFDFLMIRYLATDTVDLDPEYFDSDEWLAIEDDTIDRGTEMLNLLLYIKEAQDAEVEMSLDDFLHEFLLVDDEGFQEEHRIYEQIIENEELIHEDLELTLSAWKDMDDEDDLKDFFVPIIAFFKTSLTHEMADKIIRNNSNDAGITIAYYHSILAFAGRI